MADEPLIAVFVDFENLAIGVREMNKGPFQIELVLRRLLEKGRIVYKRAYCDWRHYRDATTDLHRHGVEMIDIPASKVSGKNSACLLYTSPSPRDLSTSRMPSSA